MRLGQLIQPGDLFCLHGEMGAGKTTFTSGIGRGWGAIETVTSPTYVLVNEYHHPNGNALHHIDCYRLADTLDIESTGLEERLESNVALIIEWPEFLLSYLPDERLFIEMLYEDEEKRRIRMHATGERYEKLLETFTGAAF